MLNINPADNPMTPGEIMKSAVQKGISISAIRFESLAEDAAGYAIAEVVKMEIIEIGQIIRNLQDAVSMAQTAEGAAGEISSNLIEIRELTSQFASGTYSDWQKNMIKRQIAGLSDNISQIQNTTTFNGIQLFSDQTINITLGGGAMKPMQLKSITVDFGELMKDPNSAFAALDNALEQVTLIRTDLGANMKTFEGEVKTATIKIENLSEARSRIVDVDVAQAMAEFTSEKIMVEGAVAMQVHGNQYAEMMLKLING